MTHAELVLIAKRLLRTTFHCRAILCELSAYTKYGEIPDAIGWVRNYCILVECKTSHADFKADQKKLSRRYDSLPQLGHWRIYLTEKGLLDGITIPEKWGLYEYNSMRKKVIFNRGIKYRNTAQPPNKSCRDSEVALLISALERTRSGKKEDRTCPMCCKSFLIIDEWNGWIWTCPNCEQVFEKATKEEIKKYESEIYRKRG